MKYSDYLKAFDERITSLLHFAATGLLGCFVFFVPIPNTTSIKEICFYIALAITLFLVITKRMSWSFRSPLTLPLALFSVWALIGLFFAINKPNSIHDYLVHWIRYIALYYLLIHFYASRSRIKILGWIILISLTVFSIGGMLVFFSRAGVAWRTDPIQFQEMEINSIGFPTLIAMMIGLTLYGWQRRYEIKALLFVALSAIGAMSLLTRSRASILAFFISLLILLPIRKMIVVVLLCLMGIIALMLPVSSRITPEALQHKVLKDDRIIIWHACLAMAKDYPLTGTGFGMEIWKNADLWNHYINRITNQKGILTQNVHSHNVLLSVLTRTGFIGLAFFVFLLIRFAGMCKYLIGKSRDSVTREWGFGLIAAFAAYFVKAMFEPGLDQVPAIFLYLILAMTTILYRIETKTEDKIMTAASS